MERERGVDLELDGGITETLLYVATCETCGWSTQGEDRSTVIGSEWQHIRQFTIGVEHVVKLHCFLITTRIDDLTGYE
jgi:hypothetical protein